MRVSVVRAFAVMGLAMVSVLVPATVWSDAWGQYGGPNRDFSLTESWKRPVLTRLWRRPLGPGTSGIVTDGKVLITHYSIPAAGAGNSGHEVVAGLDSRTGATRWEHRYAVSRLKGQESYSGDPIRPQATPVLDGSRVITLGYTGLLKCLDVQTGRLLWEKDLVAAWGATPVQFGFSSSPVLHRDRLVIHVGGAQTAVVALNPHSGALIWKSESGEPSYASPVLVRRSTAGRDRETVVHLTRDKVLGISFVTGETLWSYPLPKPGLTNVPTPILLPGHRVLISGQGVQGTRLLDCSLASRQTPPVEAWRDDKPPFFYANWVSDGVHVFGTVAGFLRAIRLSDGQELWKARGYADGNLLRLGKTLLVLRGDGSLAWGSASSERWEEQGSFPLVTGRTWTPPMLVNGVLFARSETEITAVRLTEDGAAPQ